MTIVRLPSAFSAYAAKKAFLPMSLPLDPQNVTINDVKKICDGLCTTLGEFFSTPEFDGLEQEIQ